MAYHALRADAPRMTARRRVDLLGIADQRLGGSGQGKMAARRHPPRRLITDETPR